MGHNYSDRKLNGLRAQRRADERRLAGWRQNGSRLEPLDTIEGLLARGAVVHGRCQNQECRRSVQLDLHWWVTHGLGDLPLRTAQQAYRCARLGCGLGWRQESYPAGVPVQFYVGTDTKLELRCRKCLAGRVLTAEAVIAGLEEAGTGDGNVGVLELARRIRGPCPTCKYPGWIVELKQPEVGPGGKPK